VDEPFSIVTELRRPLAAGILFLLLAWESASPFFGYFRNRARYRLLHGTRNVTLGLINTLITAIVFVHLWATVSEWSADRQFGLLHRLSDNSWLHLIGAFLLLDLWTYWWHRFNHEIPFLWRFHRVHHSDPHMDVTTANRFHIGEILISSSLRVGLLPIFGVTLVELAIFETLMFLNTQFHHANIGLAERADRVLRMILTSPAMHKVHHSAWLPETNSNYTAFLSVWDRLFRSFRLRPNPREVIFGLEDANRPEQQTMAGLMKMPTERAPPRKKPLTGE
jgi:sterol desaturase/sphingolipid hydroxylase (fatty acid hydroxylase superfamily)